MSQSLGSPKGQIRKSFESHTTHLKFSNFCLFVCLFVWEGVVVVISQDMIKCYVPNLISLWLMVD